MWMRYASSGAGASVSFYRVITGRLPLGTRRRSGGGEW